MSVGASSLYVPIQRALPAPPDIAVVGAVPGGVLLPCTPFFEGTPEAVARTQYRVAFGFGNGYAVTLRRLHVVLPVTVIEEELEKQVNTNVSYVVFQAESEAVEDVLGKGGHPYTLKPDVTTSAIGLESRFEQIEEKNEYKQVTTLVTTKTEVVTLRSVLPITVQTVVRLIGPEGEIWSASYDVACRYVRGVPGAAEGAGLVDAYVDLVNPIAIDPNKVYGLQLLLQVPSAVKTNTQLGAESENNAHVPYGSQGGVTFFYDIEPTAVGK